MYEHAFERLGLAGGRVAREVGDRLVLGIEVEHHPDIAELEAAVDQRDANAGARRSSGDIDRQRRAPDTALGREDGDDPAGRRAAGIRHGWRRHGAVAVRADRTDAAELVALARVDLADRR